MIDRLERKGFVRRRRGDGDRRQVMVEFTDEGIRRVGELYGPLEGEPLLGSFSKEQLDVMRDQLVRMRELTDRQRERLRAIDAG